MTLKLVPYISGMSIGEYLTVLGHTVNGSSINRK